MVRLQSINQGDSKTQYTAKKELNQQGNNQQSITMNKANDDEESQSAKDGTGQHHSGGRKI